MPLDWGDIPTWLTSVGSLTALTFAAVAAVVARRMFRIESDRDHVNSMARQAQEARLRRSQAALVSAWWGDDAAISSDPPGRRWGVFVRNASEVPVYQAHMTIIDRWDASAAVKISLPTIPPTADAVFRPVSLPAGVAAANGDERVWWHDLRVRLSFTDAAGVRWHRDEYGRLTELDRSLVIWTSHRFEEVLAPLREDFQAAYGVTATVDVAGFADHKRRTLGSSARETLAEVLIAPHDWCGAMVDRGLVAPLLIADDDRHQFYDWALAALTVAGQLYAMPCALDTMILLRNLDLAPDPPADLDELIRTGQALCAAGRAAEALALQVSERGDPYQLWPVFTSAGGRLFGRRPDGDWDPHRIEVDTPESVAAFERIRSLGEAGAGVLRRDIDEPLALALFTSGRCPYLISSYWAVAPTRRSGIPWAAGPVPGFRDGRPPEPFITVSGMFVTEQGRQHVSASDLVPDYLTRSYVLQAISRGLDAPAPVVDSHDREPVIATIRQACQDGAPMPSFPGMAAVWELVGAAQAEVIAGAAAAPVAHRLARELATVVDRPRWRMS